MQYKGFQIRMTRDGVWLAILPTAMTWYDGLQAPCRFTLKNQIDVYRDQQRSNPWSLPSVEREVSIAA
jgi:hypothetical protein